MGLATTDDDRAPARNVFSTAELPHKGRAGDATGDLRLALQTHPVEFERGKTTSEHDARAILDALPAEVIVLDARGTIVLANDAWRRVADCPETALATAPTAAMPPAQHRGVGSDYLAACREATSQAGTELATIAEGVAAVLERRSERFVTEYACARPDGERWLSLSAAPLDTAGQGAVIVQIDITDRKRAEQETQIARQAAAHVARVNAVGVLATSLVHELAQPLNAAAFFGSAALVQLQRADPDRASTDRATLEPMIANAEAQLERAGAIVVRLRDFLRQQGMRMQPVELDPLIEHAMELTGWIARQRRVELRFMSGSVGAWLLGDPVQLEQLMINLISNGVQAIDEADASVRRVTIESRPCTSDVSPEGPTEDSSPMVRVTVSDTGPGLDWESQHALFDLLASRRGSRLGMGLPISRDIVEGHGGKLWAEPSAGGGAAFHVMLPLGHAGGNDE